MDQNPVSDQLANLLDHLIQSSVKYCYQVAQEVLQVLQTSVPVYVPPLTVPGLTTRQPLHLPSRKLIAAAASSLILQGHRGRVYSLAFYPHRPLLISGSGNETIRFWNPLMGRLLQTQSGCWWTGHQDLVQTIAFSPEGNSFASSSSDGTIKVWQCDEA